MRVPSPVFFTVNVRLKSSPIFTSPKFREEGVTDITGLGGVVPLPETPLPRLMAPSQLGAHEKLAVSLRLPAEVGLNRMVVICGGSSAESEYEQPPTQVKGAARPETLPVRV